MKKKKIKKVKQVKQVRKKRPAPKISKRKRAAMEAFAAGEILTPRQIQIMRFIHVYRSNNGCSPTLREISEEMHISKVTIFEHVGSLVDKGLLCRAPNKARSLMLDPKRDYTSYGIGRESPLLAKKESELPEGQAQYPMAGYIAAGNPLEAIETPDVLDLSTMFESSAGTFALRVKGDSMIEEHICDGDYVLIEKCNYAHDGQIIVALLEDGEATLKKMYRCRKGYKLQGANPDFKPIYVDKVDIQGVVLGVVRNI